MLVLTRKVGEAVAIDDNIKIIVMQIKGKQVRLGIKASPTTMVHREEVYERILEENQRAANSQLGDVSEISSLIKNRIPRGEKEKETLIRRKPVKVS